MFHKDPVDGYFWIQYLSGGICILSILGSLAIILTYVLVKDIRSKARELLVHISLMDIMYSTANLVGLALPYHKVFNSNGTSEEYRHVCKAQAFIAVYGTIGSVLWTLGLAVYLYYRVVSRDTRITVTLVRVLYVVCYAIPLYVTVWLLVDDWLGYPHNVFQGGGWCSIKGDVNFLVLLMTYDIWMWLGVLTLVPLYLVIHVHIKDELKDGPHYPTMLSNNLSMIAKAERKLLLVPLLFIFLRIWDIIGNMLFVYIDLQDEEKKYLWLKVLTAIGDSGQGFFNFVIFFLFQPKLRMLVIRCCAWPCKKHTSDGDDVVESSDSGDDEPPHSTGNSITLHFNQHTPHKC